VCVWERGRGGGGIIFLCVVFVLYVCHVLVGRRWYPDVSLEVPKKIGAHR